MSLAIDVDKVTAVLLADGWHRVSDKSFAVDAYEFLSEGDVERRVREGVPSTGATWTEAQHAGTRFFCPLTAILAVRTACPTL